MKLTTLGVYGPYAGEKSGCSCHLLTQREDSLLLDIGSGSLGNLLLTKKDAPNAVILTHNHFDHMGDIFTYGYYLSMRNKMVDVYIPGDNMAIVELIQAFDCFRVHVIDQNETVVVGCFDVEFVRTFHAVENYSVKIIQGDKRFLYSSDTRLCNEIEESALDCDLVLLNIGALESETKKQNFHMSSSQAISLAAKTKGKKAVLSHFLPNVDYKKEISPLGDARCSLAYPMCEFEI